MSGDKGNSRKFDFNKSLKTESWYPYLKYLRVERFFTRPIASLIVRLVYRTAITPNHLTYISFYLGILGGIFFCFGEPLYFIIGGILVQLHSVFDCADGMLARTKDMCTRFGAFLDLFLDRIADFVFWSGIVIGYYIYSGNLNFFIAGIFAVALAFLQMSLHYVIHIYKHCEKPGEAAAARGLIVFNIFVFSLLNRLDILILGFMIGALITTVYKIITFPRLLKKK
jgi:archaetidylinositol phosphate synthase